MFVGRQRKTRYAFSDMPEVRNFGSVQMGNLRSLPTALAIREHPLMHLPKCMTSLRGRARVQSLATYIFDG